MKTEFPILVSAVRRTVNDKTYEPNGATAKCGDLVKVRPCAKKYGDRTYLGIYIGDVSLYPQAIWRKETEDGDSYIIEVNSGMLNPMIFIPELKEVVWGIGSWWGKIKSVEELKQITDDDIDNVWYVKALKETLGSDESEKRGNDEN